MGERDRPAQDGGGEHQGWWHQLRRRVRAGREIYEGIYVAPHRAVIQRAYLQQRDMLYLLAFAEMLGVPNPVTFYTLELYPEVIESFHDWHVRLGMPRSPDGGFRCC